MLISLSCIGLSLLKVIIALMMIVHIVEVIFVYYSGIASFIIIAYGFVCKSLHIIQKVVMLIIYSIGSYVLVHYIM